MDRPDNKTRERILDAAEALFSSKGYASVSLREIGTAVGMRHASLYYYAPGGKAQLYVDVMERTLNRHQHGLTDAIQAAGDDFRAQVHAVAAWLAGQPPLHMERLTADMPEIDNADAARLMTLAYDALRLPISEMLVRARDAGLTDMQDLDIAALALPTLIQSVHSIPGDNIPPAFKQRIAVYLADMLLDGWLRR